MILRSEEKLEAGDKLHILKGLFAKTQKGSKFTQRKIESLPQTQIFLTLYLCNLMMETFDFSELFDLTEFIN